MWKVKNSKIHGRGIVATKNIKKNTRIIQYVGEIVSKKEGDKRSGNRIKKYLKSNRTGSVYIFELNNYSPINFRLKGTIFDEFLTPQITADGLSKMVNRVGKFNYDSHTHSLPKKRLNAFMDWEHNDYLFSLITRYVDGYTNERPITGLGASLGYENKVESFLVFDISARKSIDLDEGNINFGVAIINALDESAPRLYDAPDFSFDTRVHDPRGRLINLNLEYNF